MCYNERTMNDFFYKYTRWTLSAYKSLALISVECSSSELYHQQLEKRTTEINVQFVSVYLQLNIVLCKERENVKWKTTKRML